MFLIVGFALLLLLPSPWNLVGGVSTSKRRRFAPAPSRDRSVLADISAGLRVVERDPRPPFDIRHEGGTKLRVIWEPSVVGGAGE